MASTKLAVTPGFRHKDNAKTLLSEFCAKQCKKTIAKGDIIYNTQSTVDGKFICTVSLPCIGILEDRDPPEFTGEINEQPKEAEKSAAAKVLDAYADQVNAQAKAPNKKRRREIEAIAGLKAHAKQEAEREDARKAIESFTALMGVGMSSMNSGNHGMAGGNMAMMGMNGSMMGMTGASGGSCNMMGMSANRNTTSSMGSSIGMTGMNTGNMNMIGMNGRNAAMMGMVSAMGAQAGIMGTSTASMTGGSPTTATPTAAGGLTMEQRLQTQQRAE
eukprot:gnl/TRDRNA2_/TRDRNA2_160751_c0_seq2.p1 gnl/TRDRNA2_/TRDRNA2_160751_c0~~gnl/TRDRNA2_/TRDRNA2_160751_c0_seq2.p1  ORF type:complete len:274 (+),score=59.64 gnl/TRDRNA2_/TRDRNA2_160751_c0_seq2:84-905(+)